jgi:hypothetical protein
MPHSLLKTGKKHSENLSYLEKWEHISKSGNPETFYNFCNNPYLQLQDKAYLQHVKFNPNSSRYCNGLSRNSRHPRLISMACRSRALLPVEVDVYSYGMTCYQSTALAPTILHHLKHISWSFRTPSPVISPQKHTASVDSGETWNGITIMWTAHCWSMPTLVCRSTRHV